MAVQGLAELALVLADWAAGHDCCKIYLFGSRVRGDHRPDSDVDVVVRWKEPNNEFVDWWTEQNGDRFLSIDSRLPGNLKILEYDDPIVDQIVEASTKPVYLDRNVICVWLPPKRET